MFLTPQITVYLFMLVIYIIILYIFDRARRKFEGGNIAMVTKMIILNTLLLLASDFTYLMDFWGPDVGYAVRMVLRLAAMCAIAVAGLRLISA